MKYEIVIIRELRLFYREWRISSMGNRDSDNKDSFGDKGMVYGVIGKFILFTSCIVYRKKQLIQCNRGQQRLY